MSHLGAPSSVDASLYLLRRICPSPSRDGLYFISRGFSGACQPHTKKY
jgi:hypothetical protein